MANKEQYLSRDGVSHLYLLIKNKLTTYFKTLFVEKKAGYDLSQNDFTNELKQKLENMSGSGGSGGGTGVSDYNELLNRPVYCDGGYSFFDGSITPNPKNFTVPALNATFYKVSDLTPTKEQMFSADLFFNGTLTEQKLTEANIMAISEKDGEIKIIVFMFSNGRAIAVMYTTEPIEVTVQGYPITVTAPSVGIYWGLNEIGSSTTFEIKYGEVKQLEDVYIPKNIPRLNDDGVIPAGKLPSIPAEKLPSYVDDVIEGYFSIDSFWETIYYNNEGTAVNHSGLIEPESGKIYIDITEGKNHSYRWTGTQYICINAGNNGETAEGAVRYDKQQSLSEEQKAQARANIGVSEDGGSGGTVVAKDEIIIVTATIDEETGEVTIDEETVSAIQEYIGDKPMYLKLLPFNWYFPYEPCEDEIAFSGNANGQFFRFIVDIENLTLSFSANEPMTQGMVAGDFEGSLNELQDTIPSRIAVMNYIGANCVALDENGKVPSNKLPSYVDDVIEGYYGTGGVGVEGKFWTDYSETVGGMGNVIAGESGKIYVDLNTNTTYRWSGSQYVKIESSSGLTALTNTEIDEIIASVDSSTE